VHAFRLSRLFRAFDNYACVCMCACVLKVEFVGVRGVSELSDIAIDNLQITADACPGGTTLSFHCLYSQYNS